MASKRLKEASKLLQIGWPLVFTFASDFSFATVAIVSSGWISSAAVASVGLTLNLLFFTITFFFVSLSAITVITAELNGSGARENIGPLMRSGFFLASVFCLLAAAFIPSRCQRHGPKTSRSQSFKTNIMAPARDWPPCSMILDQPT